MHPRDYLSYSQKKLWKSSRKTYIERYVYNGARFTNRAMAFGKMMADGLESDELTGDSHLDVILLGLPRFEKMEYPLHSTIKFGKGEEVPLFSKLDSSKEDYSGIKEYKTGTTPWTQAKVDQDEQLTFYAASIFIKTGQIPEDIELVWVPTEKDPETGKITATGDMHRFTTRRTMQQVLYEIVDMRKVWKEIGEACAEELLF